MNHQRPVAYGGGGGTVLFPAVVLVVILGIALLILLPRRYLAVAFLALSIPVAQTQQVVVFGLHFMLLRLFLLFAWLRIVSGGGLRSFITRLTRSDKVFVAWVVSAAVTYTLLWQAAGALITKLGFLYNAVGIYFLFRLLLRSTADIERVFRALCLITSALALFMIVEQLTGHNALAILGAPAFAQMRNGDIRSQGPFAHPIVAGTFGAFLFPAFVGLWWSGRAVVCGVLGTAAATVMVFAASSSTPVGAWAAGIAALCLWPLHRYMKLLFWGTIALLVGLHLVMNAPVWALLGRMKIFGASSSWHRFELVDECIRRIDEWWLLGTRDNASWGLDMWDTANAYVSQAVSGGLVGIACYLAIQWLAFRSVGAAIRSPGIDTRTKRMLWALGSSLFASCVSFLGVELFDQSVIAWYAVLAAIASGSAAALRPEQNSVLSECDESGYDCDRRASGANAYV